MTIASCRNTVGRLVRGGSMLLLALAAPTAVHAIGYTSGDVLYVAYQNSPPGNEYVVNLGSRSTFINATQCFELTDVLPSDLNSIVGSNAPNIFVGLFGVELPSTRDGIYSANGPVNDTQLDNSSAIGAVQQIDFFGNGLPVYASAVPSGNLRAGRFAPGATGSYQATLNKAPAPQGSLSSNVNWNVESRLSDANGVRNAADKTVRFVIAENNPFSSLRSRRPLGFFTLRPNGTIRFCPDSDGDLIANDGTDLCPTVNSTNQTDVDGDHHAVPCDCNDALNTVWSAPTESIGLSIAGNKQTISWFAPVDTGGSLPVQYDLFRENSPINGATVYDCFQGNLATTSATDSASPSVGSSFNYLVRAENSCGGTVGKSSNGSARNTAPCP